MVTLGLTERVIIDGVDVLPEMLAVARKRLLLTKLRSRSTLMRADATNLPIASGTYDSAYAESVIGFQSPDKARHILEEVFRVLRPSGSFVALDAVWKQGVTADVADSIYQSCVSDFGLAQASRQPWNVNDWTALMREVGFTVSHAHRLDPVKVFPAPTTGWHRAMRRTISRTVSSWYRLKGHVTPELARERRMYVQLLRRHRDDGRYVETYLFELTRPQGVARYD
jgi:SAM-dependent methyltransferase